MHVKVAEERAAFRCVVRAWLALLGDGMGAVVVRGRSRCVADRGRLLRGDRQHPASIGRVPGEGGGDQEDEGGQQDHESDQGPEGERESLHV